MWKCIILLFGCLACLTQAHPSYLPPSSFEEHVEYAPAIVGHTVHSIPTAVSHQSQTIVHEKRPYLRPIIEHAPIVKTYATPPYYTPSYTPSYYKSYEPVSTLPLSYSYSPLAYSGLYDHGWNPNYKPIYDAGWSGGGGGGWNGWPLK